MLRDALTETLRAIEQVLDGQPLEPQLRDVGTVVQVGSGIARVRGLPGLGAEELLQFPGGAPRNRHRSGS